MPQTNFIVKLYQMKENSNSMDNLKKTHGCFLGVMIGDAMGAAVEMMKPEDILTKNGGKAIDGFNHSVRRNQFKSEVIKLTTPVDLSAVMAGDYSDKTLPPFRKLEKKVRSTLTRFGLLKPVEPNLTIGKEVPEVVHGSTTDDWQLTNAVRKSLVRRKRFDITDVALAHVESYETSTSGWGGTTRNSLKELQDYFNSKGVCGRSPNDAPLSTPNRGSGNGIAMKVTPVALAHFMLMPFPQPNELLAVQVADLGRLTHSDPRAWAAAYALACVLIESDSKENYGERGIAPDYHEKYLIPNKVIEKTLQHLASFERRYGSGKLKRFSSYLKVLLDEKLLFGPIEALREEVGTNCIAIESVVFAIALFLRNPHNFRAGVLEAVNSGGDADTIASMTGGLIGFLVGPDGIPAEWINHNPEFAQAETAAKELVSVFSSTS